MSSSSLRALRILDQVARSNRPVGVAELARALSLPPGTVFRSLDALLGAGLAARYRASARYVVGPAAGRLHRSVVTRFPAREVCLPYLRQLVSISGETSSLHLRMGWYEIRICSVPGTGDVTTLPAAGEVHALSESRAGQTILALLSKREIAACRAWLKNRKDSGRPSAGGKAEKAPAAARLPQGGGGEQVLKGRVEPGVIAFPLRENGRAIAAIAIDGLSGDRLPACQQVIANIEALACAQPSLFANPFAHLDPDSLIL